MTADIANWIAVDWGTSNFRAWMFDADGQVIKQVTSAKGMGSLSPDQFEAALLEAVSDYLGEGKTPVVCCGMVGAKQGWQEAAYAKTPCAPAHIDAAIKVRTHDPRLDVTILAGVSQDTPADVMRGEETQIAGFLAQNPNFDGILCLPGTHTKWVHISANEIVSFRTFMTGELFALLSSHSVLRHSVTDDGWNDDAFKAAINDAISAPQMLGARLFGLRAEGLLHGLSNDVAKSRLSGLLIGLELAGAKPYWLGQNIALIGDPKLCALYKSALETQFVQAAIANGDDMTLSGLKAAHNQLIGNT